jgi:hypothetical protein
VVLQRWTHWELLKPWPANFIQHLALKPLSYLRGGGLHPISHPLLGFHRSQEGHPDSQEVEEDILLREVAFYLPFLPYLSLLGANALPLLISLLILRPKAYRPNEFNWNPRVPAPDNYLRRLLFLHLVPPKCRSWTGTNLTRLHLAWQMQVLLARPK